MNTSLRSSETRAITRIRRAIGDRAAIRAKIDRTKFALGGYAHPQRVQERLERLHELGYLERLPNRTQIVFGTIDMLRFFFIPARVDHHERSGGLSFGFQLLLRILEDPAVFIDPTGFVGHRDTIIGHVMRIVHCDPIYDLQLLAAIPDGLEQLESQLEQMMAGTHPRQAAIEAIIEDPGYHARLLNHVREFRANPHGCNRLLRDNVTSNPEFMAMAEIFGDLPSTMNYFASLPDEPRAALRRLFETRELPNKQAAANEAEPPSHSRAA